MAEVGSPSTQPPGASSVGRRRSRLRAWLLVAVGLLLGLPALGYALRERWAGPLLERYARDWARTTLGGELTIERVSGGFWRDLAIEGVRFHGGRGPLIGLEEGRIELGYSLRGWLRGSPELVLSIEGRGIELAAPAASGGPPAALPELPSLTLALTDVRLRRPGRAPLRLDALRVEGGLRGGKVALDRVELELGANRATLSEAELDPAFVGLELVRGARGKLEAHLPEAGELGAELGVPLRSAELQLELADARAEVTGTLELEGGRLALRRGELTLPASARWEDLGLELDLQAELTDLAPLGARLGRELAGRWSGAITVTGSPRAPTGRFVGHGEDLRIGTLALDSIDVDVATDGREARFARCEIHGPGLEAVLRGGVQLEPLELRDLALNVSADAAALAQLVPFPCERAFLSAQLDGPPENPRGTFEASAEGVVLGSVRVDDTEARGRVADGALEVAELHVKSGESTIEAAGTLRRAGAGATARLDELALLWRDTRVALERGAELAFAPGRLDVAGLVLTSAGAAGAGRAEIALHHADGATRAELAFAHYDAGPLLAPFLPAGLVAGRLDGRVAGTLGAGASGELPALALDLALEGWSVDPAWPALDGALRGEFDGQTLALERVELGSTADEALKVTGSLRVPFDPRQPLAFAPGALELRLALATQDLVRSLRRARIEPEISASGPCALELELEGEWSRLTGRLGFTGQRVTLGSEASARACDLEAELELGEHLRIVRALFSAPSGSIAVSGELATTLDLPGWLADPWQVLEAPLALEAKLDLADLAWVAGLSANLRRTSGQVAGRVTVRGTVREPSFGGALELRAGELRLSDQATPVRDVAADVGFEGDIVRIHALTGEIGGAPVRVSGTVEPFGPFRRLDLALSGQNLLIARNSHLRLRADAELSIKGTPSQLSIGGELGLAEGLYTTEISPLEEIVRAGKGGGERGPPKPFTLWPEGPLADAQLDLHVGGAKTFEYRTNLLEASLRPDFHLRGTGAFPVLEGPAYVEEANLALPAGKLKLTSGLVTFRRQAPLLPEVAFTAEMNVQRHSIRVSATGTLDALEVTPSSTPPLARDDLWILILTGQLPAAPGEDRNAAAMKALAVFLAQDAVVRWFGSDSSDAESLLDRIELDIGAKTSRSGKLTGRALFYLQPQTRRTGRATYLSAELDEYDRFNYAFGIVFRPR